MTADRSPASTPLDRLLAERAWIAALARTLVRDPAAADDAVQEVYVAALRAPPREVSRGWLASVLRNAVRMRARGEGRRDVRERRAARPEAEQQAGDIVVRAEEHRRVVDAVLALDEPYRTTVLLRFFDDLPPDEIARRMDVPLETVRARLRRSLERLRGRLDEEHGGDGAAWKAALLPLAGFPRVLETAGAGAAGSAGGTGSQVLTNGVTVMAGKTVAVAVGCLVAGGLAGWLATKPQVEEARQKAAALEPAVKERDDAREAVKSLREEVTRAHDEVASVGARAKQAEAELAEEKAARQKSESELRQLKAAAAPAQKAGKKQRYRFAALDAHMEKVDWSSVAEHLAALPAAIAELAQAFRDGKSMQDLPAEALGNIQRHNGPLVTAAVNLSQQKMPGTGPNGAFSHPAFMANAIAAALEQHALPLTDAQSARLEATAQRFVQEDEQRLARYDDATFMIQKVREEADLRDRFFKEAHKILTTEQIDALSPPTSRGRLSADLFSAGLFLATVNRPVAYASPEAYGDEVHKIVRGAMKLSEEQAAKAKVVTAEWASALPKELTQPADALDAQGMFETQRVLVAAAQTESLYQRLARDLELSGDSLAGARKIGAVLTPLNRTPGQDDGN